MVELSGRKYGAEIYDDRIRLVGVSTSAGRKTVDMLMDISTDGIATQSLDAGGSLYMAVSENSAIIKRVKISPDRSLDPDKLAQFELVASLLDDQIRYYLESFEINSGRERLAVAYKRSEIDSKLDFFRDHFIKPSGFQLRSWAMAAGYTHYCRPGGGRLICLIDITDSLASYCFVENGRPIHLGAVISNAGINDSDPGRSKAFLLDIIATIQYQMLTYDKLSQSVPLSVIIITGKRCNQELAVGIEKGLGIKTVLPEMRKELFAPEVFPESHKYLVGLGLTAE
ncbi:MAG: hypothetical protein CVT49_09015 [candidate division Zixibacteria bacterium HGW-Zixibacteria-1]|nr:MAG: hypothetical protein CVT49_09015 [candidate division Zixibacteria bacterium HGW-Zixibacteria-1]